jgi:prepilin-type N-terminal cleavage/methylation domain-containing protein
MIKEIKPMRQDTGFSLIEMLTVIAIFSILCTIAIPGLFQWLPKHRVGSAARDVKSTLEFARASAIRTNADVTVSFDWANERLSVNSGGTILRTRQLTGEVDLQDVDLGPSVTFNGQGFSSESGQVRVENKTDAAMRRTVSLTTGGNTRIQ